MKFNYIFQHGWGFNQDAWIKMIPFTGDNSSSISDRGYFGNAIAAKPVKDHLNVVITHSFGLHLIDQIIASIDFLVILSGFKHYHGENRLDGKFSKKHVSRMLIQLKDDPINLLNHFYQDCSYFDQNLLFDNLNLELLNNDLVLLDINSVDTDKISQIPQILIIHGDKDRVVPIQRSKYLSNCLKNSSFEVISRAGHGLPFTHPQECWQIIQNKIEENY